MSCCRACTLQSSVEKGEMIQCSLVGFRGLFWKLLIHMGKKTTVEPSS